MSRTPQDSVAAKDLLFRSGWVILLVSACLMALNHFMLMFVLDQPVLFLGWGVFNLYSILVIAIPFGRQERWAWYATWILPAGLAAGGFMDADIAIYYVAVAAACALGLLLTFRGIFAVNGPAIRSAS